MTYDLMAEVVYFHFFGALYQNKYGLASIKLFHALKKLLKLKLKN